MTGKNRVLVLRTNVYKLVLLLFILLSSSAGQSQGLQFNSNDSLLSKRTSYAVFKTDQPTFSGHLYISFDLSLWDNEHLGYIVNITDAQNNSYSLSSIYNQSPFLNFNIDSKSNKINIPLRHDQLKKRNWMKIKIDFDLKANTVGVFINNKWYKAKGFNFENTITPKIYFGKNEHYSDVPKMAIRNLTVGDTNKSFSFLLNEWKGSDVLDSKGNHLGLVDNPVWLINESYFWAPRFTRSFKSVAGVNFDEAAQNLILFSQDSLITYDVQQSNLQAKAYQNKCPIPLHLGKSIINIKENKLYAYETLQGPRPAPSIASLNLNTLLWDSVGRGTINEQRHHHNIFYNRTQDTLYLFGGYGSYAYYKDFFRYNRTADTWEKVNFSGDKISPRFFSGYSTADKHNEIYLFGGYGNQSGNQIIGGKHFYDLYKVNLSNRTIKKCWEIKPPAIDFVAANNLILSKDHKYFYAICYAHDKPQTVLRLYKFSVLDGTYEIVSGSIPAKGERIESDINLFFNQSLETFYCAIQEFTTPDYSTVRLYSLSFPPVKEQEYLASQQPVKSPHSAYLYIVSAVLATGFVLVYLARRQKRSTTQQSIVTAKNLDTGSSEISIPHQEEEKKSLNAIYLLGEFTVYDKSGRDITYLFSPKIKQLFILVLINSRHGSGVVSKKISTTLWPDKDIVKTKNIKGVTINHLRNIIADIDGLELTFLNDTYYFKISQPLFCDYFIVADAVHGLDSRPGQAEGYILNHFELIARGGLLQSETEPWLDDVKLHYEEALMPKILPEVKKIYESGDYRRTIDIARVILNTDPFNDAAIKYKLKALQRIKGIEFAHKIYSEFTIEYERSLGEAYYVPFEKICTAK